MSLFLSIFAEIRSQSRKKSIQLSDLIDDLDPKNAGKLSTIRFRRLFNLLSIWIENDKFDQLASEYRISDTDFIDISKFLNDYENPPEVPKQLVTDEQLREFGKRLVIQNTTISDCVDQFDKYHSGHVCIDYFLAAFGTSPFTRLLAQQYSRPPTNDVYYLDLAKDVDRVLKEKPLRETTLVQTMSKLPPYFKDVANTIRLNGTDPYQVLSCHDKFKKMTILPAHFKADVSNLGLSLTANQMDEITELFSVNNRFDYVSFCEAIDQENESIVKETKMLSAKEPEKKVETADINDVIAYIQTTIKERHSLLCDRLAHFDPLNTGKLSERQFFKILDAEKFEFRDPEKVAVLNEFSDGENVDYKSFSLAVTPPQPNPLSEAESIYERLKNYLFEKQLQVRPYFERLDSEKKGTILFSQLLSILRNILFDINVKERRLLKASTGENVSTDDFCAKVDPPFLQHELAKEEEEKKLRTKKRMEEEDQKEIEIPDKKTMDALARIASVIDHENIVMVNEFRRYENSPLIRPSTFRAVLFSLPVRISDDDIELFINRYLDQPSRLIDTVSFLRDIESYGMDQLKIEPDLSLTLSSEFTEPSEKVKSILRHLKVVLKNKNLSASAIFRPYDQSSFGFVSRERLHSILSYIGFMSQITTDELNILESAFQPNNKPDLFNYRRMILVLEQLEIKNEDYQKVPVYHSGTFSGEYQLVNLTNTIHSKLQARHKTARCVFYNAPDEPIPYLDFRERVMNYGLVISQADLQLLMRSYRANMNGDIDWMRFCDDVDTIKTVQPPH